MPTPSPRRSAVTDSTPASSGAAARSHWAVMSAAQVGVAIMASSQALFFNARPTIRPLPISAVKRVRRRLAGAQAPSLGSERATPGAAMSDVFISYARSTEAQAKRLGAALAALGYGVWRDDELPPHRAYGEVIEERLNAAKAVVVLWSAEAVKSHWVRAEADAALAAGKLVQLTLDGALPPMPFNQTQCADLAGWTGDLAAPGWAKVAASIADLAGAEKPAAPKPAAPPAPAPSLGVCVLPFVNMSGDPEQDYFSDGVSENIITDLSKVSALSVVSRNSAFQFKGQTIDVRQVARQLGVTHVLEGSVRRAGERVRITAQLIDAQRDSHVWAERYDRDLTDIFALQDEISQAIVAALKLKLVPSEQRAITRRGTASAEAYDLGLMARQLWLSGEGAKPAQEAIVRLARRAIDIDPRYAEAWALMAQALSTLQFRHGRADAGGLAAAEKALSLDPNVASAHAVKARHLAEAGRQKEADAELATALRLDPAAIEVNEAAAYMAFRSGRMEDAIRYYEAAAAVPEGPFGIPAMLITCYEAIGDRNGAIRSAKTTLERAEAVLKQDPNNADAVAFGACALAALGEGERARDWVRRALLIDPDSRTMRYNLACALATHLGEVDEAIALLKPYLARATRAELAHVKADPDLKAVRADPRFIRMLVEAEWRFLLERRPRSEQSHMQLGAVLLQEDRYQDALAEVTKALEIAPKRNDARSLRGNILATLGQINQAALDWNVALAGDPDDTVALSGLAVFLRQTDPDRALKYAQHAVDLTNWIALGPMRVLAMVYRARGDEAASRGVLTRALMVFPNNETLAADLRAENMVSSGKPGAAPPPVKTAAANLVVIPPLAVGGLTLGADAGDFLWMDPPPLPPSAAVEKSPAVETKPVTNVAESLPPPEKRPEPKKADPAPPKSPPPAPAPSLTLATVPAAALSGLTLGAPLRDLVALNRLPSPPPVENAVPPPASAPPPDEPVRPILAPAPSRRPAVDLHWGKIPLSTITPAFVYGAVPPPREKK